MDPTEAKQTLDQIRSARASQDEHASLELHLLDLLADGVDRVAAYLDSIPDYRFSRHASYDEPGEPRFVDRGADRAIVVTTFTSAASSSVDVGTERTGTATEANPLHTAFYSMWESLGDVPGDDLETLQSPHREIFLIGLLEAEVMNGGLGQYLSNTDGRYVRETSECLRRIGATATASLLAVAERIAEKHGSFAAAWEAESATLSALDEQFLNTAEDLASLAASTFGLA